MTHTFSFKTARGSEIKTTIEVNHMTEETFKDGWGNEHTKTIDIWDRKVKQFSINGKEFKAKLSRKMIEAKTPRGNAQTVLPEQITEELFGEEIRNENAELESITRTPKTNVCPKCGTYCYGDCTA